jgi:uncharacterized protein with beta-barrel porin domain
LAHAEEIVINQTGDYTLNRSTPISGGPRVVDVTTDGIVSVTLGEVTAVSAVANGAGIVVNDIGSADVSVQTGNVMASGSGQALGISVIRGFAGSTTINAASVSTSSDSSDGIKVVPSFDLTTINAASVTTTGANSNGIYVSKGFGGGDIIINADTVNVSGNGGAGITSVAMSGSVAVVAPDVTVASGRGILANGYQGTTVTAGNVSAGGIGVQAYGLLGPVAVTTTGAIQTTGSVSYGVYLLGTNMMTALNSGAIVTTGDGGVGILTNGGAGTNDPTTTSINNIGSIETFGGDATDGSTAIQAHGIWVVSRSGPIALDNQGSISTSGAAASGIVVESGSGVTSFGLGGGAGGPISISNSGTITTTGANGHAILVSAGSSPVTIDNTGSINGNIDMGAGDGTLILRGGWTLNGAVTGGAGNDALRLAAPSSITPYEMNGGNFTSFETTNFTGGTVAISGTFVSTMDVQSGYVFGRPGSTLTGNISVASGATFGSAGTVHGNLTVAGTLSPGASPGILTVNGNVALASSSRTLFEMTPSVSDQLAVNGTLTIAENATLNVTGARPLTPGTAYSLITTTGGISGDFTTSNKAATVLGFLRQTANTLDLVGTIQIKQSDSSQTDLTVDYINAQLIAGTGSSAFIGALPTLLTVDGMANEAVLRTISPEAYASAAAIGIENGLALSRALRRAHALVHEGEAGIFAFGQGYGNWNDLASDSRGVSQARVRNAGFLGGLGYGSESASVSAFVGRSESHEAISGVQASTDAGGLFFGGKVQLAAGGFSGSGSVIADRSEADMDRNPAGVTSRSHFALHGTTIDTEIGYALSVGRIQLRPSVGLTHVSITRGRTAESGGGPFALSVTRQRYKATYVTGDMTLSSNAAAKIAPWMGIGLRHRADGDYLTATGELMSAGGSYTVDGVRRSKTFAHVATGFRLNLSPQLLLYTDSEIEFGDQSGARQVDAGVRYRF